MYKESYYYFTTHSSVDDLAEVYSHRAGRTVLVFLTLVYEDTQATRPDLTGSVAKHKQHRVYHIRLAAAVRTND